MNNTIFANIFGIIGTVIWSVQLIPQILLNFRRKSTVGLSPYCFLSWYLCGLVLGTYLIFNHQTVALIIQILLFSTFCSIIIFQFLFYERQFNQRKIIFSIIVTYGGSMILGTVIYELMKAAGKENPSMEIFITVVSGILMLLGFLPQIYEIYEIKSSMGVSKIFVVMDAMGGVSSILSLLFKEPFDLYAFSTYVIVPIFQAILLSLLIYYDRFYPKLSKKGHDPLSSGEGTINGEIGMVSIGVGSGHEYDQDNINHSGPTSILIDSNMIVTQNPIDNTQQQPVEYDHLIPEESESENK